MKLMLLTFGVSLVWLSGYWLARLHSRAGWAWKCSTAFPFGACIVGFAQICLIWARVRLSCAAVLLALAPALVFSACALFRDCRVFLRSGARPYAGFPFSRTEAAALAVIIACACVVLFSCAAMPPYTWDSRGTWMMYAKIFHREQTIYTPDFLDPYRYMVHQNYPVLVPLNVSFLYTMMGVPDDYLGKLFFGFLYVSFTGMLFVLFRRHAGMSRAPSLVATALASALPCYFVIINGSVPSAYADFPLSCFYLLAVGQLLFFFRGPSLRIAFAAGVAAAACLLTKNEGIPLFLLSVAALLVEGFSSGRIRNRIFLAGLLMYGCLPPVLSAPWWSVRSALPTLTANNPFPALTLSNLLTRGGQFPLALKLTGLSMLLDYTTWGVFWVFLAVTVVLRWTSGRLYRQSRQDYYLLAIPLVYFFFFVLPVYVLYNPYAVYPVVSLTLENEFKYTPSSYGGGASFARLWMHVIPLLFLFIASTVRPLTEGHGQER